MKFSKEENRRKKRRGRSKYRVASASFSRPTRIFTAKVVNMWNPGNDFCSLAVETRSRLEEVLHQTRLEKKNRLGEVLQQAHSEMGVRRAPHVGDLASNQDVPRATPSRMQTIGGSSYPDETLEFKQASSICSPESLQFKVPCLISFPARLQSKMTSLASIMSSGCVTNW
jgi:hypothetical protein